MPKRTRRLPRPPSPFLRLPVEVIDIILTYAYGPGDPSEHARVPYAVFCRHLQPSFARFLYRDAPVRTLRALQLFCATLRRRPDLAVHVRILRIDFHDEYWRGPSRPEPGFLPSFPEDYEIIEALKCRRQGHGILSGQDLMQLWLQLSGLRVLILARLPPDLETLLCGTELQQLTELEELHIEEWRHEHDHDGVQLKAQLARHPRLRKLHFRYMEDMPPLPSPGRQDIFNAQISALSITCDQGGCPSPDFAGLFPELRDFFAVTATEDDRVSRYIEQLPASVRTIDLRRTDNNLGPPEDGDPVWDDVLSLLPDFPDLDTLYLPYGTFDKEELVPYLRSSRIRRIGFDWDCQLSDDTLSQIVRLPQIEHITLNHLREDWYAYYRAGLPPIKQPGILDADWAALQDVGRWNLCSPQWPDGGTWEGLQAFFAKAEERDVVVDGTALAIKKRYEDWRQEQLAIVVEQGVQRGDWSTADESDFSWQEIRDYMARQWTKERKEHFITPPGPAPPPLSSSSQPL
ncbi:hypothetical protein NBRC10512_003779 [Rhodotorula toruloides]|uniref:RHTO0S11e02916g1_1 n=2 Tax=Rhodotorula toruloides TaxID=5286 RepID=A0A061B8F4_RHOTO|nr:uncharacterized protein RHTO_03882 [Rhodotorula toruloides NP11]EMS20084.1 hypothetical protein RHTO_03882 [Rhodotorula toruloides NP11]CDR45643.1 RHTO0S11e02916g1_1 [Rhodotorula toruloides]